MAERGTQSASAKGRALHPNTVEAREHRRAAVMHAARCLFRDPRWVDPSGDLSVWEWLCRIPYMDTPQRRIVIRSWLRNARIEGSTPVADLKPHPRERLIFEMARFAKGQS